MGLARTPPHLQYRSNNFNANNNINPHEIDANIDDAIDNTRTHSGLNENAKVELLKFESDYANHNNIDNNGSEVEYLKSSLNKFISQNKDLIDNNDKLNFEFERYKSLQTQSHQSELQSQQDQLDNLIQQINLERSRFYDKLNKWKNAHKVEVDNRNIVEGMLHEAENEREDALDKFEELERKYNVDIDLLNKKVQSLESQLNSNDNNNVLNDEQVIKLNDEIHSLQSDNKILDKKYKDDVRILKSKIKNLENDYTDLEKDFKDELTSLKSQLKSSNANNNINDDKKLKTLEIKIKSLEVENESLKIKMKTFETDKEYLNDADETINDLRQTLNKAMNELKSTKDMLKNNVKSDDRKVKLLEVERDKLRDELTLLESSIDNKVNKKLKSYNIDELNDKISDQYDKIKEQSRIIKSLKSDLNSSNKLLQSFNSKQAVSEDESESENEEMNNDENENENEDDNGADDIIIEKQPSPKSKSKSKSKSKAQVPVKKSSSYSYGSSNKLLKRKSTVTDDEIDNNNNNNNNNKSNKSNKKSSNSFTNTNNRNREEKDIRDKEPVKKAKKKLHIFGSSNNNSNSNLDNQQSSSNGGILGIPDHLSPVKGSKSNNNLKSNVGRGPFG